MEVDLEPSTLGPAMRSLSRMQQRFVVALFSQLERNHKQALRDAGYKGTDGSCGVQAHRWAHDPRIKAALAEIAPLAAATLIGPIIKQLESIASNPQHKDQARVLLALHDRYGGATSVQETKVTHEHKLTEPLMIAGIKAMAARLGLDPTKLLGGKPMAQPVVVEAEFVEVVDLTDLEDVL